MSTVTALDDGFGDAVGDRMSMIAKPGSHTAYAVGSDLMVEWYDFGDHAPYESANLLVFNRAAQLKLAEAMGEDLTISPHMLASRIASRFRSYFDVKQFATMHRLPFRAEVEFQP